MANWEYTPQYGYQMDTAGPPTLQAYFEDGTATIRQKNSTQKRIFSGRFRGSVATIKAMLDFWDTKTEITSFTMLTYDPQATTPSTDSATVYFVGGKPVARYISSGYLEATFTMREA